MNPTKRRLYYSMVVPAIIVFVLWLVKIVEWQWHLDFVSFGILPRKIEGLKGILFSFFIHGDFSHLVNNSLPLLVLGWALFFFYKDLGPRILVLSYVLSALYTWISAREAYHIGASGVVYALFGFLFISGFIRRSKPLVAISFLIAFLYGSLVWGILPWDKSVSWEGHFWGLFVGLILAIYYRNRGPQRKVYQWEDEEEEGKEKEFMGTTESQSVDELEYEYHFIPKEEEDKSQSLER
ncbi:MAG: rhomboid family intramembrane serine protease [Vicingaceae bacterium]